MASDPTIGKTAHVRPLPARDQSTDRQVERQDVAAQALIAKGQYWKAYLRLRDIISGPNDPDRYPLMQTAATALRHLAARFAMGDRAAQRLRVDLLEQAAQLLHGARDYKGLYRMHQAILQARLNLGDAFPIALAAHQVLNLGLETELMTAEDLLKTARLLADTLERTVTALRDNDKPTWKQVLVDKAFQGGELLQVKALAYRLTADGLSAAHRQMGVYAPMYRDAANAYKRSGRILQAMVTLGNGILLGAALNLPEAMDAAADRLVFFATQLDDKDAIASVERAIGLVRRGQPEDAHRFVISAARLILNQLPGPLDIAVFLKTSSDLAEHLWNDLEEKIRLRRGGPDAIAERVRQQRDMAQQQYALWRQVLDGVMPLVARESIGRPLDDLMRNGLDQLHNWAEAFHMTVISDRMAEITRDDYQPEAPSLSPELVRAIAATDWFNPRVVSHLTQILAETYGVTASEIEHALLPGTDDLPLTKRLRADIPPHTFGRATAAMMQIEYKGRRRHRWDVRVR